MEIEHYDSYTIGEYCNEEKYNESFHSHLIPQMELGILKRHEDQNMFKNTSTLIITPNSDIFQDLFLVKLLLCNMYLTLSERNGQTTFGTIISRSSTYNVGSRKLNGTKEGNARYSIYFCILTN